MKKRNKRYLIYLESTVVFRPLVAVEIKSKTAKQAMSEARKIKDKLPKWLSDAFSCELETQLIHSDFFGENKKNIRISNAGLVDDSETPNRLKKQSR